MGSVGVLEAQQPFLPFECVELNRSMDIYSESHFFGVDPFVVGVVLLTVALLLVYTLFWLSIVRLQNHKLKVVLDGNIAAMAVFHQGKVIEANRVALEEFGYTREEFLGKGFFDFVDPLYHQTLYQHLRNKKTQYDARFKRKDGSTFWGYIQGHQIDQETRISSLINIDALRQAQSELERLNHELQARVEEEVAKNRQSELMRMQQSRIAQMGEVISMIAHQWRQPLNNLYLLNQKVGILYTHDKLDERTMQAFQQDARKQIEQMSDTINDFCDFFKPDKEKSSFNLMQVVKDTVEIVMPTLKEAGIAIDVVIESKVKLLMEGYPSELRQALINLINNAKDAFAEGKGSEEPWIRIRLYSEQARTFVEVEDSAGGIPEAIMETIFDPYFSTKLTKQGTGLGLYMSKMIVEEHQQGILSVTNGAEGARFTMSFSVAL